MSADFVKGQPYGGWQRSLAEFATFDTYPEFQAAIALDQSTDVDWWLRNDPAKFRIPTPIGFFEPDFIYGRKQIRGVLEIKGGFLWQGPGSNEEIKAGAACDWVRAQNSIDANGTNVWEFAVVIAEDVSDAPHLDALRGVARRREP